METRTDACRRPRQYIRALAFIISTSRPAYTALFGRIPMKPQLLIPALLACVITQSFAEIISVSPLKAVPRWGNSACWVDTGGRLKNNCSSTQSLSFPVDQYLVGKTVTAWVYTDAPFAKLK